MTDVIAASTLAPPPPRPLTPRASKRAWGEAPVRFWWKSAAGLAVVALIVAIGLISSAREHRRLMLEGLPVVATIIEVEGTARQNFAVQRDHSVAVKLNVRMPNGESQTLEASLPPPGGYAKVGAELAIRIDPNDPRKWAEQTEVDPWWKVVAVPMLMMLPVALALVGIAAWRRRRVLSVWRDGAPGRGVVVDVRHAATAPKSRMLRYSIVDGGDRRIFSMIYPIRAGVPQRGDTLDLLVLPQRPEDSIVTKLYDEPRQA